MISHKLTQLFRQKRRKYSPKSSPALRAVRRSFPRTITTVKIYHSVQRFSMNSLLCTVALLEVHRRIRECSRFEILSAGLRNSQPHVPTWHRSAGRRQSYQSPLPCPFRCIFLSSGIHVMHPSVTVVATGGEDPLIPQSIRISSAVTLLYWLISLYARNSHYVSLLSQFLRDRRVQIRANSDKRVPHAQRG